MRDLLWWVALAALAIGLVLAIAVGGTVALVAAIAAALLAIAAAVADGVDEERRPW